MGKNISVFGLGYVGTVLLTCLAKDNHNVIGVDIDPFKVEMLLQGQTPVLEEGIQELVSKTMQGGGIKIVDNASFAISNSEISFICVGTPSLPNGKQDLSAVYRVVEEIGEALRNSNRYHVIVVRSTVKPGTVEGRIKPLLEEKSGKKTGEDFGLCFMPEFLREGTSVRDYFNPPFSVVGGDREKSINIVRQLFDKLPAEFIATSIPTAEMLKYCCNVFHALKITFANEIGRICQSFGIDAIEVMNLACKDTQLNISPAYLKPGFAFGGSCLPKDLRALTYLAKTHDVSVPLISMMSMSNQIHIDHAVNTILATGIKNIGLVGISFKGGTDDLRESPYVLMAERFIGKGLTLKIYDEHVNLSRLVGANRQYIEKTIPHIGSLMCEEADEIIIGSQAVIVGQKNEKFLEKLYSSDREDFYVLDLVGAVDKYRVKGTYQGLCW
jgi:GDP-mannose 6-dehydrogenase